MGAKPQPGAVMPSRFFISHSGTDKALAVEVADLLRPEAWVDLYEIDVGDILLEEIARGIEQATDFVLLWSVNSSASRWVRFEFHMAFIRWLEENALNLRIVSIDRSEVPLYFRPFLQLRNVRNAAQISEGLSGRPPKLPATRSFVNRSSEIGRVEQAFYSPELRHVWAWGVQGIGKRSMLRQAFSRLSPDPDRFKEIALRGGIGYVELNLLASAALGTEPVADGTDADRVRNDTLALIAQYIGGGGIWCFTEAQHWLRDDATPTPILSDIFGLMESTGAQRLVCFSSTRQLQMSDPSLVKMRLSGLAADFGVALLQQRGADPALSDLRSLSEALDGHPLALEIAAADEPADEAAVQEQLYSVANQIVGSIELKPATTRLLEVVAAVDGPLPGEALGRYLEISAAEYQAAVQEASSYSLIEESERGYLQSHAMVRDFFLRSFRRGDEGSQALSRLADLSLESLRDTKVGTASYIDSLTTSFRLLALSMRLQDAFKLRQDLSGVLFQAAVELYQSRRYREALPYFEEVVQRQQGDIEPDLYRARCLAYLGRVGEARETLSRLTEPGDQARVLRVKGRVEYVAENYERAASYYELALSSGRRYAPLLVDLAQARLRSGEWVKARAAIESAVAVSRDNPSAYALNIHSQVLEHFGDLDASRLAMEAAVLRDPANASYHHRLGRIAELGGDKASARREYETSIRLDPDLPESLLSLASVCAELRDFDAAKSALSLVSRRHAVRPAVLHNVTAKVAYIAGDLAAAQRAIDSAMATSRDDKNLGLAARILIARGASRSVEPEVALASVELMCRELTATGAAGEAKLILADAYRTLRES